MDGSRYALVHAVAKRARQITLWLTADPAELRAEAAPPPAPGELTSRDPVALAEAEILDGEVRVRWDPEGRADEEELVEIEELETDPLLIEGLAEEDDAALEGDEPDGVATPALAQVLDADAPADEVVEADEAVEADVAVAADELAEAGEPGAEEALALDPDDIEEISLEDVEEPDDADDEDEPEE